MYGIYYSHRRQLEHIAFVDPVTGGMNNARFQYSCRRVLDGAKAWRLHRCFAEPDGLPPHQ